MRHDRPDADRDSSPEPQPVDTIGQLLRRAGPPAAPEPERRVRVERAARQAWAAAVRRRRLSRALIGGATLAACLALLMIRYGWPALHSHSPLGLAADGRVATLLAATGELIDPATGRAWPAESQLAAGARIQTAPGVRATLALGRGRTVRIDESSRVELAAANRLRLSSGALYVDSPPSAHGAPIEILTPLARVREVGTRFEVRVESPSLSIRVRHGRVALWHGRERTEAGAGERLDLDPKGEPRRGTIAATDPAWSWTWRAGLHFTVEGASLDRFLEWYEDESGRAVQLPAAASELDGVLLHGSVVGLTPEEALVVVARSAGLTVRARGEGRSLEWVGGEPR